MKPGVSRKERTELQNAEECAQVKITENRRQNQWLVTPVETLCLAPESYLSTPPGELCNYSFDFPSWCRYSGALRTGFRARVIACLDVSCRGPEKLRMIDRIISNPQEAGMPLSWSRDGAIICVKDEKVIVLDTEDGKPAAKTCRRLIQSCRSPSFPRREVAGFHVDRNREMGSGRHSVPRWSSAMEGIGPRRNPARMGQRRKGIDVPRSANLVSVRATDRPTARLGTPEALSTPDSLRG